MILMATPTSPTGRLRDQISSRGTSIIQVATLERRQPRVTSVRRGHGMEGEVITTQEIYRYARKGIRRTAQSSEHSSPPDPPQVPGAASDGRRGAAARDAGRRRLVGTR